MKKIGRRTIKKLMAMSYVAPEVRPELEAYVEDGLRRTIRRSRDRWLPLRPVAPECIEWATWIAPWGDDGVKLSQRWDCAFIGRRHS